MHETVPDVSNLLGALIFFWYIVAALSLSSLVVYDLVKLHQSSHQPTPRQRAAGDKSKASQRIQLISFLTVLSFAFLSYHMLNFLIVSYTHWTTQRKLTLPRGLFGPDSVTGFRGSTIDLYIWQWATSSTLFQDFAESLTNSPASYFWVQNALLYSYAWNTYMSIQGYHLQVPRLWAYFILDQILPVSFTQNLFLLATELSTHNSSKARAGAPGLVRQVIPPLCYITCLCIVPLVTGTWAFLPVLFSTRLLLFSPLIIQRPAKGPGRKANLPNSRVLFSPYKWLSIVFGCGSLILFVRQLKSALSTGSVLSALNRNPAVSALSNDFLLGCLSLALILNTAY